MRNRIALLFGLIICLASAAALSAEDPIQADEPQTTLSAPLSPDHVERPTVPLDPSAGASVEPRQTLSAIPGLRRGALIGVPSRALFLAHLYVTESGVAKPTDRAIMVHVLDDRRAALSEHLGRPVGLVEAADRYSGGMLRRPLALRTGRLKWILALDGSDRRPVDFPNSWDWSAYNADFVDVLSDARAHLEGKRPPDPCDGLAGFWGGRGRLATTTDAPRGSMEPIVCHPDQVLRTYSTRRTRTRFLYRSG